MMVVETVDPVWIVGENQGLFEMDGSCSGEEDRIVLHARPSFVAVGLGAPAAGCRHRLHEARVKPFGTVPQKCTCAMVASMSRTTKKPNRPICSKPVWNKR